MFFRLYLDMLKRDGCLRPARLAHTTIESARFFFGKRGVGWQLLRHGFRYLSPTFHPWQRGGCSSGIYALALATGCVLYYHSHCMGIGSRSGKGATMCPLEEIDDWRCLSGEVAQMERQHRKILGSLRGLCSDGTAGVDRERCRRAITTLWDYATFHFLNEERLMLSYGYDGHAYRRHLNEHKSFITTLDGMRRRLDGGSAPAELSEVADGRLIAWIERHIEEFDVDLVRWIERCRREGKGGARRRTGSEAVPAG
ncbi:bacteriohemerythrin [Endothiovibrio diazotrophicus]